MDNLCGKDLSDFCPDRVNWWFNCNEAYISATIEAEAERSLAMIVVSKPPWQIQ